MSSESSCTKSFILVEVAGIQISRSSVDKVMNVNCRIRLSWRRSGGTYQQGRYRVWVFSGLGVFTDDTN